MFGFSGAINRKVIKVGIEITSCSSQCTGKSERELV